MTDLAIALRLARRELRAGLHGFRLFFACLALGVAAIAGVGTLSESVVAGLRADSRTLLGGDVDLRLQARPAKPRQIAHLAATSDRLSRTVEMRAMARPATVRDRRSMIELKAVDQGYPLVGTVTLDPPLPLSEALAGAGDTWGGAIDANLLTKLDMQVGDRLRVGDADIVVRAIIVEEPDRVASLFSFGPRVLVSMDALPATGLVRLGSRISHHTRVLLPPGQSQEAWIAGVQAAFPKAGWRIRGTDEAAPGIRRFVDRMTLFLTFVGLTALLVGGIGIGNAVNSYLERKTATIATLKCLGAPGRTVFATYMIQILVLAVGGIAVGVVVGGAAPAAALAALGDRLPVTPQIDLYPWPLALAAVFGLLTAVTFALWPLARAREVPAANLFRNDVVPVATRPRLPYVGATVAGFAALAVLTIATANDRYFAYWFVGGAAATLALLRLGAVAVMAGAARLKGVRGAELRLVLANLHRPGAPTPNVVLSLGLGLSVLVAVALIENNLGHQVSERLPEEAPSFFFIDIQPDQVADFDATVSGVPGTRDLQRVPTMRGRIVRIDGVPVGQATIAPESAWAVRGDRSLTYAAEPSKDTLIVDGEWWPSDYRGPPIISFDAGVARGFGVGLGDTLTFNVFGREVTATIANLREIDWRTLRFDFAVVFAPGVLEGAPHTHIAAVRTPPEAENAVERAVSERFANITSIRVREALEAAARILAGIGTAVRGTAAITLVAGALVLAGAVAAGRHRRIYDAVVFKVLGATRRRVLRAFLIEYGILGLFTGVIAAAIGTLTAWAVVVFLMGMEWGFSPATVAVTVAVCVALTIAVGFTGTWRAMGRHAAPYLRNE